MTVETAPAVAQEARRRLPPRYQEPMKQLFLDKAFSELQPGISILDVGSGCDPSLPRDQLPTDCTYVGLDLYESELLAAPPGSYDEICVADILERQPQLQGKFDLIVSWQVLEHVKPLEAALDNVQSYLKPGGRFIAQFSGSFSVFGLVAQVLPTRLSLWVVTRIARHDPEKTFPAHFHHSWHGKLDQLLSGWSAAEIVPRYRAASYFRFFRPLQRAYLLYEDRMASGGHKNLASHYLVDARR